MVPGCGELVDGGDRGDRHLAEHRKQYDQERGPSSARGYGARWQRLRLVVLRRNPICQVEGCTQVATKVDHIVRRSNGGTDELENLQGLCKPHNSGKTAHKDGRWTPRRGYAP